MRNQRRLDELIVFSSGNQISCSERRVATRTGTCEPRRRDDGTETLRQGILSRFGTILLQQEFQIVAARRQYTSVFNHRRVSVGGVCGKTQSSRWKGKRPAKAVVHLNWSIPPTYAESAQDPPCLGHVILRYSTIKGGEGPPNCLHKCRSARQIL